MRPVDACSPLVFSGQQNSRPYQCDPTGEAAKNDAYRRRLLSDELSQDERSSHEVRELAQRLDKHGTLPRLESQSRRFSKIQWLCAWPASRNVRLAADIDGR